MATTEAPKDCVDCGLPIDGDGVKCKSCGGIMCKLCAQYGKTCVDCLDAAEDEFDDDDDDLDGEDDDDAA